VNASGAPLLALLVENDHLQRETLAAALASENLDVIECASAAAAELIVSRIGTELQVLIVDLWLSNEPDGAELARYAAQQHPRLRILVISGDEDLALPEKVCFIRKPYSPADVVSAAVA